MKGGTLTNCELQHIRGKGNKIIVAEGCKLHRCFFMIKGDNNVVIIGKDCKMSKTSFNSVVAARATVNKQIERPDCIIAGAPAKQIKESINWDRRTLI